MKPVPPRFTPAPIGARRTAPTGPTSASTAPTGASTGASSPASSAPAGVPTGAPTSATERAARVRLLILDVDGVLTDGRLFYGPQGESVKAFDVRDGLGVKLLHAAGIATAILSARRSAIVAARARELGIARVLQGESDKSRGFAHLMRETGVTADCCAFMGDDWPDLAVLRQVGFAATVADARPEVQAVAHWIAHARGGRGAVREAAEFILRAQGRLDELRAPYERAGDHA